MRYLQILIFLTTRGYLCGSDTVGDSTFERCAISDAKTSEEHVLDGIFPTTLDEYAIFEYKGVRCDECNDNYDGPCPLHVLKYVAPRKKPSTYLHHRAAKSAPKNIVRVDESGIPHSGAGLWAFKKIPANVVFGPLDGKEFEKGNNDSWDTGYFWKKPGTNNTYLDLLDKHKTNFLSYINCARNIRETNMVRYFNDTDNKYYFRSTHVIPKYTELLVDYGSEYRKTIGISDLDYSRPRDLKRKIFVCDKCLKASYTPVDLMPHHLCPKPNKKEDPWLPILANKSLVQKQIITHEEDNAKAFKTVWECRECAGSKPRKNKTKQMTEKEMKLHYIRKHANLTDFDPKTVIRDDYVKLNKLCNRFYKCNICSNKSAGLNWTITPVKRPESIEFEKFVAAFEQGERALKEKNKNEDFEQMNDVILNFGENEEEEAPNLKLTTQLARNKSRQVLKLNKNFFFKLRDDAQCHYRINHMDLCNISDVRVMKYKGDPHECDMCGNATVRELLKLDHHVEFHLNFSEMFDRGLVQIDYRTKRYNEPYLEGFNFSHFFCQQCNQYIDTNKSHEPSTLELLEHKLSHINLNVLSYSGFVERKRVQIVNRPLRLYHNITYLNCHLCRNFSAVNKSDVRRHLHSQHRVRPYKFSPVPATLAPKIRCSKCNETFDRRRDFVDHMTFTHKDYYYCVVCGKTNYYRRKHQRHLVKVHKNSTATLIMDDWSNVEKLWTSLPYCSPEQEPTYGDSIFKVDNSCDYNSVTEPHIQLRSLGN